MLHRRLRHLLAVAVAFLFAAGLVLVFVCNSDHCIVSVLFPDVSSPGRLCIYEIRSLP